MNDLLFGIMMSFWVALDCTFVIIGPMFNIDDKSEGNQKSTRLTICPQRANWYNEEECY